MTRSKGWPITMVGMVAAVLVLVSCGEGSKPDYQTVTSPSISSDSPIPVPTEDVVLTVSGKVATTNTGDFLSFDMPTLEKLGLVEYTVDDPWLKQPIMFTGVLMSDLLEYAGTLPTATTVHLVALDDFEADIAISDIKRWPVLLAIKSDGEYMSVENYGPTRIVFPYHSHSDIDPDKYNDLWVWQIASMDVR